MQDNSNISLREKFEKSDYFINFTPKDKSIDHSSSNKHKFRNDFISYDVDSKEMHENSKGDLAVSNLCPFLDELDNSLTDSKFFGIFYQDKFKSTPYWDHRNSEIVNNLEKYSYEVGNNYTTGWLGAAHCADYNNHLVQNNSPLLNKTLFVSIETEFSAINQETYLNLYKELELSEIQNTYFINCLLDSRIKSFIDKGRSFFELAILKDPSAIRELKSIEEYHKSPSVLHINVSMSGDESSIFPWQVADLDIFN